jgi:hypothetical protein
MNFENCFERIMKHESNNAILNKACGECLYTRSDLRNQDYVKKYCSGCKRNCINTSAMPDKYRAEFYLMK